MPLRIEQMQPSRFVAADGTVCHAMQVTDETVMTIVNWCDGTPWQDRVSVPLVADGVRTEAFAEPGEWVYTLDGKRFSIASDAGFRAEFQGVRG